MYIVLQTQFLLKHLDFWLFRLACRLDWAREQGTRSRMIEPAFAHVKALRSNDEVALRGRAKWVGTRKVWQDLYICVRTADTGAYVTVCIACSMLLSMVEGVWSDSDIMRSDVQTQAFRMVLCMFHDFLSHSACYKEHVTGKWPFASPACFGVVHVSPV